MVKQVVFIVTTGPDGSAVAQGFCKSSGPLDGPVKSIQYITDNRVPFEPTVSFSFTGADTGVEVLTVESVEGRQTWNIDGPELKNEPIKVVVTNGGKGRSGSFVVTCK
jgi:hypothetical protein